VNKEYILFGKKLSGEVLVGIALGFLMVILIFFIILPQIQGIATEIEKNRIKNDEVQKLRTSLGALNAVTDDRLESDVQVLTEALPTNKEVISVFTSLISLATNAGVQVRGFTIQVGEIYTTTEKEEVIDSRSETGFPSMNVVLSLTSSDQRQIVSFSQELYKSFPIAKINSVASQDGSSSMEISFYYRPYDIDKLQNTREVPAYTDQTLQLLDQLRKSKQ
jgi:hypothetical protein